jgi:hypothetical protein
MAHLLASARFALAAALSLTLGLATLGCSTRGADPNAPTARYSSAMEEDTRAPAANPDSDYGYGLEGSKGITPEGESGPSIPKGTLGTPPPDPSPTVPGETPRTSPSERGPLLIYDAELTLAVFETNQVIGRIEALARENKGYLVQRTDEFIKIRIPAEAFGQALETIAKFGDELHRNVNVRDVTEEFADLEARLRALRAVRERLEALLQKAEKTEDALAVERELQRVTSDMESMLGKLKVLSELVAFSTITVSFQPRPVDKVGREHRLPFPWLEQLGLSNLLTLDDQP